jgi:hypothetical protein
MFYSFLFAKPNLKVDICIINKLNVQFIYKVITTKLFYNKMIRF